MQKNYRQMFEEALLNSQKNQDPVQAQLEQEIMSQGQKGPSLSPTLSLIDTFTGTNLASQAPQQVDKKDQLAQLLKLRQGAESQKLEGLGKLAQMQDAAEGRAAERAFREKMYGLQALEAQAKMNKSMGGGARKLGTEDIKAIDNIDMILGNLPKLKQALSQGQSLKPSLLGYTIGGDNDATTARRMVIEALGRLQSGGAIGNEEFKNFENLISAFQDDPTTRASKIDNLMAEFGRRRNSLYYGPQPTAPAMMNAAAPARLPGSQGFSADDIKGWSPEQVMAYAKMKGMI